MAEQEHVNDDEFRAALSRLRPRPAGVQRDRVMYLAGRASRDDAGGRGWLRVSMTAAGWLLAAGFCGLWLNRPEPVVVTQVEYVERVAEPLRGPTEGDAAVVQSTDGIAGSRDRVSPRTHREGRGNDLDALIAGRLHGAGRERNPTPTVRSDVNRVGSVSNRPEASYIALMKVYLDSPQAGSFEGGEL